jgi:hypothetical protein
MHSGSASDKNPSMKDSYTLFRDRIVHEDNLINNRTNWLLGAQSLLFAAFGILLRTIDENHSATVTSTINSLKHVIPIIGISISVLTIGGVSGAISTMVGMRDEWNDLCSKRVFASSDVICPKVMTQKGAMWLGFLAPVLVPVVFTIVWCVIWCRVT